MSAPGPHRIGEFARRVGVSPELLRAWERRYGLLDPVRSPGGFRLYTEADALRVGRMLGAIESGLSAAQAAQVALDPDIAGPDLPGDSVEQVIGAIDRYDESAVQALLDASLSSLGVETVLRELLLPVLTHLGDSWQDDGRGISREHFASNVIRGRLLSLARLWGRGTGPLALLACIPGEAHDISLIAFGLVLRTHGWRILFLGADTPLATLAAAAATTEPDAVVLSAFDASLLESCSSGLRRFARHQTVYVGGPGASAEMARRLRLRRLNGDLIAAAGEVSTRRS